MTIVVPDSELFKRAVAYLAEMRRDFPERSLMSHVDDAGMRFNLSPLDTEALVRLFFHDNKDDEGGRTESLRMNVTRSPLR